jgi:hypothetical protein
VVSISFSFTVSIADTEIEAATFPDDEDGTVFDDASTADTTALVAVFAFFLFGCVADADAETAGSKPSSESFATLTDFLRFFD